LWKFLLLVGVVVLLTGCEVEDASIMMIGGGSSGGDTIINNFTYNITNNITYNVTSNNYYNQSYKNNSVACADANSYLWNVTQKDGVLSGLCAADSEGSGTDTNDTVRVNALYAQNLTNYGYFYDIFSANTALTNLGARIDNLNTTKYNLAAFIVQNTSYFNTFYDIMSANTALTNLGARIDNLNQTKASVFANSSTQCSGTDKLTNITSLNGLITGICSADQTGAGGGANYGLLSSYNNITSEVNYLPCQYTDFLNTIGTSAYTPYYQVTTIGSGTYTMSQIQFSDHPGIINISSSATANSGVCVTTQTDMLLLNGSEESTHVFIPTQKTGNMSKTYMGFIDQASATLPVDGVFFNLTNLTLNCIARNNSVMNISPSITLTNLRHYKGVINTSIGKATCRVYLDEVLIAEFNMTSNVPTGTYGRTTGHGFCSTVTGATTAQGLVLMDYQGFCIKRRLSR